MLKEGIEWKGERQLTFPVFQRPENRFLDRLRDTYRLSLGHWLYLESRC